MKKTILTLMAVLSLSSVNAQAEDQPAGYVALDKDAIGLQPIAGEVTSTQVDGFVFPVCPPGAQCMPYSKARIELNFTLMGCLDRLGPVTYTWERSEDGRKATVYVSTLNIYSRRSMSAMCFVAPMAQRTIELRMSAGLDEVEVKFLTGAVAK